MAMKFRSVILLGLALSAGAAPAAADSITEKTEVCAGCHGADGKPVDKTTPVIWGQLTGYIYIQLRDFKRGDRKSEVMQQVCDEEARSGWELVEKFDDTRLRFKRPTSARNIPSPAGIDPYRTTYGISQGKLTAIILIAIFGSMALIIGIAAVANHH